MSKITRVGVDLAKQVIQVHGVEARRLAALGLQPRLIAPHFVTPYRMEGTTNARESPRLDAFDILND